MQLRCHVQGAWRCCPVDFKRQSFGWYVPGKCATARPSRCKSNRHRPSVLTGLCMVFRGPPSFFQIDNSWTCVHDRCRPLQCMNTPEGKLRWNFKKWPGSLLAPEKWNSGPMFPQKTHQSRLVLQQNRNNSVCLDVLTKLAWRSTGIVPENECMCLICLLSSLLLAVGRDFLRFLWLTRVAYAACRDASNHVVLDEEVSSSCCPWHAFPEHCATTSLK